MVVWCMFEEVRSGAKSKEPNTHQGGSVHFLAGTILRLAEVSGLTQKVYLHFSPPPMGGHFSGG